MSELRKVPAHYRPYSEALMSNFDHVVEIDVQQALEGGALCAAYPGMNFHGTVWEEDGKWWCEVWTYGFHAATFSASTPKALMDKVSEEYGYE